VLIAQIVPAMRLPILTLAKAMGDGELTGSIAHYPRGCKRLNPGRYTLTPDLVPEVKIACRKEDRLRSGASTERAQGISSCCR
jgi:hypothetical protein